MNFVHIRNMLHGAKVRFLECSSLSDVLTVAAVCAIAPFRVFLGRDWFSNLELRLSGGLDARKLHPYEEEERYNFNGIYLPKFDPKDYSKIHALYLCISDVLFAYLHNNDCYDKDCVAKSDRLTCEGVYCYRDEYVDLTIKEGDVVLDIGSCFGEFAVYAAKMGATCYAFEPSAVNRKILEKTVDLNKGNKGEIVIVPFGADERNSTRFMQDSLYAGGSSVVISNHSDPGQEGLAKIETVCLDDWAEKNNVTISFIKADIEGFERNMLKGATRILKTQQPILSLCTYHLPDDPKVMRELILAANPNYKIIQRRMKLLAYIPELHSVAARCRPTVG